MRHDDKNMNPSSTNKNAGQWGTQSDKKDSKINRPEINKGKSAQKGTPSQKGSDTKSRY